MYSYCKSIECNTLYNGGVITVTILYGIQVLDGYSVEMKLNWRIGLHMAEKGQYRGGREVDKVRWTIDPESS
jgi:hypothetical protein